MNNTASFGFKSVASDEKESLVRGVFDSVASKYDIMNDLMSGGLHRLWKNTMVSWLNPQAGIHIIDVAGGTGDIAVRIRKKANCRVTIIDINEQMLLAGRDRLIDTGASSGIEWTCGNAEALPIPNSSADAYTIAFGIRNVTHIDKALSEAFRVLKPGGRFMCLEFSEVKQDLLKKIYDEYSFRIIPQIGKMVTGDAASYQYLVESIRRFPNQEKFADMIKEAGFGNVQYRSLTQGVVAIHSGRKF